MKKLLAGGLLLLLGLPPLLSFIASYYLQNNFTDNFGQAIQIKRFDYKHGWFNSNAQIDFELQANKLLVETQNRVNHGPVIWSLLTQNPLQAFSLYQVNSHFQISENTASFKNKPQLGDSLMGSASTVVSYTGKYSPKIEHPGMALRLPGSQIYTDLAELNGEFSAQGTGLANFSANQIEVKDSYGGIYATQPRLEIALNLNTTVPSELGAGALSLSGFLGRDEFNISEFVLTGKIEKQNNRYDLFSVATANVVSINNAVVKQTKIKLQVFDINQELINYFSTHNSELVSALQNNQWLILLKHFSALLKRLNQHQPNFVLDLNGLYDKRPVSLHLFGKLATNQQSRLNPFSFLESLEMELETDIPTKLITQLNRPELTNFLDLMSEKGLLISKNESYHSKLSFQGAKLKIAHDTL